MIGWCTPAHVQTPVLSILGTCLTSSSALLLPSVILYILTHFVLVHRKTHEKALNLLIQIILRHFEMNGLQGLTRFRAKITRIASALASTNSERQQDTSSSQSIKSFNPEEQLQSPFFSELPFDVRTLVYNVLVADVGDILHIAASYVSQGEQGKMTCYPCMTAPSDHVGFKSSPSGWDETHTRCKKHAGLQMQTASQLRTFMPLLLSCKRMYV